MAKQKRSETKPIPEKLTSWLEIAAFLGQPMAVAQRWAKSGMPVQREGRYVTAAPQELNDWLGRESGQPVHVATGGDLAAELKRGLAYVRKKRH